jgi:ferric-dicitrate binding protein FerR (iron transport regulator)
LTGEAFFEVARNEQKPFIIHTPNTKVRVLGTSFNIRAFSDESITETVVMTGKVSVADTKNTKNVATLLPNQKATLIAGQPKFDLQNVEAKRYTQWKDGILQFDNENLNTVLKTLSNHYGYDFYPENPNLFNCRLTAKFENKPIDKILKYLELALKISYQIESKKIILKGSGC